tara:strand:- start:973 stop:1164 length:192 start_codon:yes stop_codon:yes gene_type:complete
MKISSQLNLFTEHNKISYKEFYKKFYKSNLEDAERRRVKPPCNDYISINLDNPKNIISWTMKK